MGTLIEGLDDHEGYVLWWLADGALTAAWTNDHRRQLTGYVANCECGWRSDRAHPPTDHGEEAARQEWVRVHAVPELAHQAARRQLELTRVLEWLGSQAGRLHDPVTVDRVRGGLDHAWDLIADVQRDLERSAPQREAEHER